MKTIAAFDFDGTLTSTDSFIDFLSYVFKRWNVFLILILYSPLLIWKEKGKIKELIFKHFFQGMEYAKFKEITTYYAENRLPEIINSAMVEKVKAHQKKGDEVMIISASVSEWITPWATKHHINQVLSTEIEVKNGQLTGYFRTPNCKKEQKVHRLFEIYPDRQDYILYAYGNSSDDKPLLDIADYPVWV
ncbi:MAG: HAD-IB family hydrolase [Tannerellaceae bacterium]|nr:HAD-IB family hydrolase [Tannerellaceae bacterium]